MDGSGSKRCTDLPHSGFLIDTTRKKDAPAPASFSFDADGRRPLILPFADGRGAIVTHK